MKYPTIARVLGVLLMLFSLSMLPPVLVAFGYHETEWPAFLYSFGLTLFTGFLCWAPFRKKQMELKIRDGFVVVTLFWFVLSLFAALPFMLADEPHLSLTDAVFESVSGFTTTGATVITGVDYLSHAIRMYRQELQFLGGMGIVVLAIAVLPMLGIGGLQLYQAEVPGPAKDQKLTPRITETAKALWYIYVGLNVACAVCYWLSGMSIFDAIGESFSTISTGGFAMHDTGFGFYNSPIIEVVGGIFMLLGATSFSLHFVALQRGTLSNYWKDAEFRTYIAFVFILCVLISVTLISYNVYNSRSEAIVKTFFNTVSVVTTTGFTSADFGNWPTFVPVMMMMAALIGGCASSTSGGLKLIRVILVAKQGMQEVKRLIHPKGVLPIKLGGQVLPDSILRPMWGFLAIFGSTFAVLLLALLAAGLDLETAFGSLVACIANEGVGIGDVSGTFTILNDTSKWILTIAMLAGRLEVFTLLVLFTPAFWRA